MPRLIIAYIALLFCLPGIARAQLISPGELSMPHANLEGITNCTSCHQLGQVGINNTKCLDCHTPLASRLNENLGFHATIAEQNCGDCHKDHFGRDFDVLRFEPDTFDHTQTEYPLVGAHVEARCRSCHRPEFITLEEVLAFKGEHNALSKTWLGLTSTCVTCHASESVHGGQFGDQNCASCHNETEWAGVPLFDHSLTTFPLTGKHIDVTCDGCHTPFEDQPDVIHFAELPAATCASCHLDTHQGALDSDCAVCHITDGWDLFTEAFPTNAFNHDLTNFALTGSHAEADCASCHTLPAPNTNDIQITYASASLGSTFPEPQSDTCISCHTDAFHNGAFADTPGGIVCDNCHGDTGWSPTTYGLERHNEETTFALTGAHLVTPCFACHQNPDGAALAPVFHFEDQECQSCHLADNPHGDQFVTDAGTTVCASCHGTNAWGLDDSFDHSTTQFTLTGKHATASCESCHTTVTGPSGLAVQQFRGTELTCEGCHVADNPHQDQFTGQSCQTCHDAFSFFVEAFDHSTTRFSLEGAHEGVACSSCHGEEQSPAGIAFIRYKPLGMACQDCHDDIN